MQAVAPVVVLVLMLLLGMQIDQYTGQSISQAFQNAQNTHNYTVDSDIFNNVSNDYINNPEWANTYISSGDVQEAHRRANDGFIYTWLRDATGLGEQLYDAFNHDWTADVDSRVIYVYDNDGNTIGATYIIGLVRSQIQYQSHVTTVPELLRASRGGQWVLFYSISAEGSYYHTDFDGFLNNSNVHVSGMGTSAFGYPSEWSSENENASSVYFTSSNIPNYVHVWFGVNQSPYLLRSPVVGRSDIATENETIGEGVLPDGTVVPVYPNGAVVLPDGTVVNPSSDGTYPITVDLTLDQDYWAELAKLIADETAAKNPAIDAATEKELLDSIRDTNADTLDYLKRGFWTKLKEFFTFDETGLFKDDWIENPTELIKMCWEQFCSMFGITPTYS